jgi:hypothetical protein
VSWLLTLASCSVLQPYRDAPSKRNGKPPCRGYEVSSAGFHISRIGTQNGQHGVRVLYILYTSHSEKRHLLVSSPGLSGLKMVSLISSSSAFVDEEFAREGQDHHVEADKCHEHPSLFCPPWSTTFPCGPQIAKAIYSGGVPPICRL